MRKTRIMALAVAVCLCLALVPAAGAATPAGWEFKEVLPCEYDDILWPYYGVMEVQKNGKWGLADETGTLIAPCQYDAMRAVWDDFETETVFFAVEQNGKWGLIDLTGAVVLPLQYDAIGSWGDWVRVEDGVRMLLRVQQNGKQGFIDQTGTARIPLSYTDARDFSRDYAAVADDQGRWGFIDTDGQEVIPCQYSAAGDFDDYPALAPVKTAAGQWQFIDQEGAVQITCQGTYDRVDSFGHHEQFAVVTKGGKRGLIDREGKEFWTCKYDDIQVGPAASDWSDGSWTIYGNQKTYPSGWTAWQYGLLSGDGTVDTGMIYERNWELYMNDPFQGLNLVSKFTGQVSANGYPYYAYGYVDLAGEEVIPCKYDLAGEFSWLDGLAAVELNGKAGFIDATGQTAIPMTYGSVSDFGLESLAPVATGTWPNHQWGIIDTQGNTVIPCSYACDWMNMMTDGLVWVQKNDKTGLVAMTCPGAEDLDLPVEGTMVNNENGYYHSLYYTCSKLGQLYVPGASELKPEEKLLAAMYNEAGKLTKVEVLSADKLTAWLDTSAATAKLFWLGDSQKPQSSAAILWER